MPDLISLKPMTYRHRALRPGMPFSVPTAIEATLLKRARCAADAVAHEQESEMDERPARPTLRRKPPRYQRRDMRADD